MKVRSLVLGVSCFIATLATQNLFAADKPLLCLTVGTSNNGKVLGVRVRKENEKYIASIDEVTMFHDLIVSVSEQPLKEVEVRFSMGCGIVFYSGEGVQISYYKFLTPSEIEPFEALGQLSTKVNGQSLVDADLIQAASFNSGYCD